MKRLAAALLSINDIPTAGAAEPQGIAPVDEGRICQPGTKCLAK